MKVGSRVKRADATEDSIPAYRDMVGTVVKVAESGAVCVEWDIDQPTSGARYGTWHKASDVVEVEPC